jgi:hypothetical protein
MKKIILFLLLWQHLQSQIPTACNNIYLLNEVKSLQYLGKGGYHKLVRCAYIHTVRKTIISLLNPNNWQDAEIREMILKEKDTPELLTRNKFRAKKIAAIKNTPEKEQAVFDSIVKSDINTIFTEIKEKYKVSRNLIKICALSYYEGAIPIFENAIATNSKRFDLEYLKLCLARLRVKKYEDEILEKIKSNDFNRSTFEKYVDIIKFL